VSRRNGLKYRFQEESCAVVFRRWKSKAGREKRFQVPFPGKKPEQYAAMGRTMGMNVFGMTYHALTGANLRSRLFKKELKRNLTPFLLHS